MHIRMPVLAALLALTPHAASATQAPSLFEVPLPLPRPAIQYTSLVTSPRMRIDPPPAAAAVPNATVCKARDFTGQLVTVSHRLGGSVGFAQSNWDVGGRPTITYSPSYFRLSPTMQRFASLHECGHLVLQTHDEYLANCHALRHGRWQAREIAHIRQFHQDLGTMPAAYGKSGAGFWQNTMRACAEFDTR